ncbi:hypothetical protein F1880_010314 [Penicillium rolfsii]|nr:hypothetical protein F1880_010314 [Penicillium rolfsii]
MPPMDKSAIAITARAIWSAAASVVCVGERDSWTREKAALIQRGKPPRGPLEALRRVDECQTWAKPSQCVLMFFVRTQVSNPEQALNDPCGQTSSEENASTFHLNALQRACLDFCTVLLEQHYQTSAFGCALVYGLAALGYDHRGWLPFNAYVDELSKVIWVGQSFVVQSALLMGSDSEDCFEYTKDAKDWLGKAACHVPKCILVGTNIPVDWMMSISFEN